MFDLFKEQIITLLQAGKKHTEIHQILIQQNGYTRGMSLKTLRRFIQQERLNPILRRDDLLNAVGDAITQVAPYYGRRMLAGTLRASGVAETRIRDAMIQLDPLNHSLRVVDQHNISIRYRTMPNISGTNYT